MRTLVLATCALMLSFSVVFPAEAQDRARPNQQGETHYTFTDELVRGDLVRPEGWLVSVRRRRPTTTLIRAREHFLPELYRSVESL